MARCVDPKPKRLENLEDFIERYNPANREHRQESWSEENPDGRWRKFSYEEIIKRDKTNLDIFWIKDNSLTDLENLPEPDIIAAEIVDEVEAGLDSFREVAEEVGG